MRSCGCGGLHRDGGMGVRSCGCGCREPVGGDRGRRSGPWGGGRLVSGTLWVKMGKVGMGWEVGVDRMGRDRLGGWKTPLP